MDSDFDIHSAIKFISDKTGKDEPIIYKIVYKPESLTDEDFQKLKTTGILDLRGIKNLKKLPDNIRIKLTGHIYLEGSGIEEFPRNLKAGMIDIINTPLEDKLIQIGVEHFIQENAILTYRSLHRQSSWFYDFRNIFLKKNYGFNPKETFLLMNTEKFAEKLSEAKDSINANIYSLRNMIQESVIEAMDGTDLEEATYPSSFNMEEFKKLNSFNARIEYCNQHLKRIASGSARVVYQIDDQTALKLAKNKKGLIQNAKEADNYIQQQFVGTVAKVLDYHPDDYWIEMQYAKKITPRRFEEIMGFKFKDFTDVIQAEAANKNRKHTYKHKVDDNTVEKIWETQLGSEMIDMIAHDMFAGDWNRISSYGELDGEVVLVDYGLSQDDYETHYEKPRMEKASGRYMMARMYENID